MAAEKIPSKIDRLTSWISNLSLTFLDKIFLLGVLIITVIISTQVFASPEFIIRPNSDYLLFEYNNTSTINKTLVANDKITGTLAIKAQNYNYIEPIGIGPFKYDLRKKYPYPIFLNYSFIDVDGNKLKSPPKGIEVEIDHEKREIMADEDGANVSIIIRPAEVSKGEHIIRFWGRGAERFVRTVGPFESLQAQESGKETIRRCTVNLIVREQDKVLPVDRKEEKDVNLNI
jgi:hypothetical protein